ncbi:hypothetical protein NDU88_008185 [Pleurodeles waltl]|uniref:Uncharacterized protein n=1 Tax=Pleurodeles waltl TaxID=8319 RepID=A0AAV7RVB8_PLEWA|nr:hypothetical protein NDU88_008185 [Pleurodeles waltl]
MALTRGRKKAAKRQRQGSPGEGQHEPKNESTERKVPPNPAQTKKSPRKSLSKGKKAGYKITDLLTKKESNPTSALMGVAPANDSETTCAAYVKTAQDIERTCADLEKISIPIPQANKTGLTIIAEIHRCYLDDTFSTLNLSNWNNWGENLCCTPFSKQASQVENDTDCIIIEEFPLIDLSDTCSDTPQGTQIANNKTKMRSTCSTSSLRKDLSSCNITTTTTFDTHVSSAVMAMEQQEQLEELEDSLDHTTGAKANVEPSTSGDSWKALLATMDAISAAIQFQADKQDTQIRNEWNRLPIANIIISAPVTYDTKKLKWKEPGLDIVMEEVYHSAGTTKELKESLSVQELEDHPKENEGSIACTCVIP